MRSHDSGKKTKCNECSRMFDEEWKLKAHIKTHISYSCENCGKNFKSEDVLSKHKLIAHENHKLFCHYYNNQKECPFGDDCIFLHEDSSVCKYRKSCERINCMFKHEIDSIDANEGCKDDEDNNPDENIFDVEECNENDESDNDETVDSDVKAVSDLTFCNPSLADEVFPVIEEKEEEPILLTCELCIFTTNDKRRFERHQFENHSVKGKYICIQCKEEFDKRKQFNSHNYHGCG